MVLWVSTTRGSLRLRGWIGLLGGGLRLRVWLGLLLLWDADRCHERLSRLNQSIMETALGRRLLVGLLPFRLDLFQRLIAKVECRLPVLVLRCVRSFHVEQIHHNQDVAILCS